MLTPLLLLAACGSDPSVAVTTATHPDAPAPKALSETLESEFQRPIQRCYKTALETSPDLAGTVRVSVYGSHGILKQTATGGAPQALIDCALSPLQDSKRQRRFGDGPSEVGFVLDVVFAP